MWSLKKLPFEKNSLEPIISEKTIDFHYGKHHQTYVNKLNDLTKEKPELNSLILEDLIKKSANNDELKAIFNNAAQVFNHDFFWQSLSPEKKEISPKLLAKIEEDFTSLENFKEEFIQSALAQFGSGWAWLVKNKENKLEIIKTANADNPLSKDLTPVFTIDVWEHAYYLDYQNKRAEFVEAILDNLVNWDFIEKNLEK